MTTISNKYVSLQEASSLIQSGKTLLIAGDHSQLKQLPKGNWIGGTTANFMTENGGVESEDNMLVTLIEDSSKSRMSVYNTSNIDQIGVDSMEYSFTLVVIPAQSELHLKYAQESESFEGLYDGVVAGWISGIPVKDLGSEKQAKVVNGSEGELRSDIAVALHVQLNDDEYAMIDIVNTFAARADSPVIQFEEEGFSIENALINGKRVNFADYCLNENVDIKLPLVADAMGHGQNVSFQGEPDNGVTNFYAPVTQGMTYRFAEPIEDYIKVFVSQLEGKNVINGWSCNCILNFLYSELEGKKTGISGPITFGEIAYRLLNQTATMLTVESEAA